jgi:6-phosphogluconate dehydrogenase
MARIWKGSCIIGRASPTIRSAFLRAPELANLLLDEAGAPTCRVASNSWRRWWR